MSEQEKPTEESKQSTEVSADMPLPGPVEGPKKEMSKDLPLKNHWTRFRGWYVSHKKWSIPASVVALLLLFTLIPFTRYPVAGLFIKKDIAVYLTDNKSLAEISAANVSLDGKACNAMGAFSSPVICHKVRIGKHTISATASYYKTADQKTTIDIGKSKIKNVQVFMTATGRPLSIQAFNKITGKPIAGLLVKSGNSAVKTNSSGYADLIIDPNITEEAKVEVSGDGYNSLQATENINMAGRHVEITPAGKVYFLSKLSGKIDVVKTNLDGSSRQTVLAGTGKEDNQNTVLLASRDWKYLALLSRRDSDLAKLYLIETGTDKVTAVDEGNATFSLIGWSDSNFVYQVDRLGYQIWQPKQEALKSYSAATKKITLLDETDARGSNNFDGVYETFNDVYIVGQRAVYAKAWFSNYSTNDFGDAQLGIYSINVTGSGGRATHKSFSYEIGKTTYLQALPNSPDQIYYQVTEKGAQPKYYVFANGQVSEKPSAKDAFDSYFNGNQYITYLLSPSGNSTFWTESRDGKNSLFVGDSSGGSGKQIVSLSDYQTYGWFSDDYLLVSRHGSELYTLGVGGIKKDSDATKITDYHKPVVNYPGYGGGYGGL